jgi:acetylornithine/N-succinyldiaminopimelate aminotransferase
LASVIASGTTPVCSYAHSVPVRPLPVCTSSNTALLARVRELGERLIEGVRELPRVVAVRGRGLMVACDVQADAPEVARRALLEQRLVVNATGPRTLRFLPPLVVSDAQIDEALSRVAAVLNVNPAG